LCVTCPLSMMDLKCLLDEKSPLCVFGAASDRYKLTAFAEDIASVPACCARGKLAKRHVSPNVDLVAFVASGRDEPGSPLRLSLCTGLSVVISSKIYLLSSPTCSQWR
jgi:hypothetical protein